MTSGSGMSWTGDGGGPDADDHEADTHVRQIVYDVAIAALAHVIAPSLADFLA